MPIFITAIAAHGLINTPNKHNETLLMIMAENGQEDYVRMCLEAGANINATCKLAQTALMKAVNTGKLNAVKTLIGAGANVNIRDYLGETALGIARFNISSFFPLPLPDEHINVMKEIIQLLESVGAKGNYYCS